MQKFKFLLWAVILCPALALADDPLKCNAVTDGLCVDLWNASNKGNMSIFDGQLRIGKSDKSDARLYQLDNYRAVIASLPRLPEDMRDRAAPILKELEDALGNEQDNRPWYKRVSDANRKFTQLIGDVVEERQTRRYPELMKIKKDELSSDQIVTLNAVEYELNDEVLEAKYRDHANWRRVSDIFETVRSHLLIEIPKLNVSDKQKEYMLNQVKTVSLTLPYPDPRLTDADDACASTTVNAFYSPSRHKFTICAGLFNAFQSPAALYFVTAHEISHSIDAGSTSTRFRMKQSDVSKALNRLLGATGPVYNCDDWKKLVASTFVPSPELKPVEFNSLEKFYSCLMPKELQPFATDPVRMEASQYARYFMGRVADSDDFLKLAQPQFNKFGEIKQNEYYMRPDRINQLESGIAFDSTSLQDVGLAEIFTQSLSCQGKQVDSDFKYFPEIADKDVRNEMFLAALKETYKISQRQWEENFIWCGKNCSELADSGISVAPNENWADWMAGRAFKNYLALIPELANRRQASAISTALFCDEPGAKNDAPGFAEREKNFSMEPHPDNRIRRISVYNDKTAELVQCTVTKEEQGFGACEP